MSGIDSIFSSISSYFFPETTPVSEPSNVDKVKATDPIANERLRREWAPERPILTPPQCLPMCAYRLLEVTSASREIGNKILDGLSYRISVAKDTISDIAAENMKILRDAALRARNSDWWSALTKIANAIFSAVSIVFGMAVSASGGTALIGGAMIASGILSLANFALAEMGTWHWIADLLAHENEERKQQLAWMLPAAFGILAAGIGITGSVNGVASGALNFAEKAASVALGAVNIFQAATTFGSGVADYKRLHTEADLQLNNTERTIAQERFDLILDEVKGSMSEFRTVGAKTKTAIKTICESNIQLVR